MFILLLTLTQLSFAHTTCSYVEEKTGDKKEFSLEFFDERNLAKMTFVGPNPDRFFVARRANCLTQVATRENQKNRPIVKLAYDAELCVEMRMCGNVYTLKLDGKNIALQCTQEKCSK